MNPFESLDLSSFELSKENVSLMDERTLIVIKWNWDYQKAWDFQKKSVELLQENPRLRVFIVCNHPRVFTNGRGLQRAKKGQSLELMDFTADPSTLPFPYFKIERGGGLTFHHPGQFIFYPIVKLNPKSLSLSKMIDDIFEMTSAVLTQWGLHETNSQNELLGLWKGQTKLASMGIAIEKLTTYHGMALNLINDQEMRKALQIVNPCGINASIYGAVENYIFIPQSALDHFALDFLQKVKDGWK